MADSQHICSGCGKPGIENPHAADSQQNTEAPSQQRQQPGLGEQLPDDPQAAPAEGQPDGDLTVARSPLHDQHVRQIQAGDHQDDRGDGHEDQTELDRFLTSHFLIHVCPDAARRAQSKEGSVSPTLGVPFPEARDQGLQLRLGDAHGHTRLESSDDIEPDRIAPVRSGVGARG